MPVFPLYEAQHWVEDTWDESPDKTLESLWSFAPIGETDSTGESRFAVHLEGGERPKIWVKAEVGSELRESGPEIVLDAFNAGQPLRLSGKRLFSRLAGELGWDARSVALRATAGRDGLIVVSAPSVEADAKPVEAAALAPKPTAKVELPLSTADVGVPATPFVDPGLPPGTRQTYGYAVWRCLVRDYGDLDKPSAEEIDVVTRSGLSAGEAAAAIASRRTATPATRPSDRNRTVQALLF